MSEISIIMSDKLTIKQEKFAQGLFAGLSQREAYKQAYNASRMKDNTIDKNAYTLANDTKITTRLEKLTEELKQRNMVTVERVLQEYARLAFFDPRKVFDADGSPKSIVDLDDDTAAAVAGLEVIEIYEGRGSERKFVGNLKKYKISDKIGALDSIGKHLGMFIERKEVTGPNGGPIEISSMNDNDRLAFIKKVAVNGDEGD